MGTSCFPSSFFFFTPIAKKNKRCMDTHLIPQVLIALIFSFFFSGIEIAFLSANKLQIELQGKQGARWARIMSRFIQKPSNFIGTTLIGNTLALVLFGIFTTQMFEPVLARSLPQSLNNEAAVLLIQTLVSTMIVLHTAVALHVYGCLTLQICNHLCFAIGIFRS